MSACLTLVLVVGSACAGGERFEGAGAPEEAAAGFVRGVLEGDVDLVSRMVGYQVTAKQVEEWRREGFLVDEVLQDVQPDLVMSYRDDAGASLVLEGVAAAGDYLPADGVRLASVAVFVARDRGWRVLDFIPVQEASDSGL